MTQFNLLPDVKIEYIKTKYRKRLIMLISIIASAVTFGVFVLLFLFVRVSQPKHIRDLDKDIKTNVSKIQSTPDLDKVLTIQNQLNSLPGLHDQKVESSRLIDYLTMLTPNQATLSTVDTDFAVNTMTIRGSADSLITVNKFVDTLKFTDYKVNAEGGPEGKAFKDVVLRSFSMAGTPGQSNIVTFDISLAFEPIIFTQVKDVKPDATQPVSLTVPKIISTRSETEKPDNPFLPQGSSAPAGEGQR
jgi:hypothetical protein